MLVERLSQRDKSIILNWISTYSLSHRDGGSFQFDRMAPLDLVLRAWDTGKQTYLWKMFGEQFILEREVSYRRPDDLLYKELVHALNDGDMHDFKDLIYNKCEEYFYYFSDEHRNVRRLFEVENLKENRYSGRPFDIVLDKKTKIAVPRGAKVMKILNKLAKLFHYEAAFEKFRISHSQILNQKALTGTLCLSIHPFDYMTMSDNTYDWDSCMSWENNGCYRAGTTEMMNSPYMVIAYLKGDKPFRVGADNWEGNKKWRELFIVHPHAICNIKGYPYKNDALSMLALDWLRELAARNLEWQVPYNFQEFEACSTFTYEDGRSYYFYFETNSMYNDFNTDNTCHRIIVPQGWQEEKIEFISQNINISGPNICICCGDHYYPEEGHEDQVLCDDCDPGPHCSCCGCQWDEDELRYVDGNPLCPDCFADCAGECALSEDYYYSDDLVNVYLAAVDDNLQYVEDLRFATVHIRYTKEDALTRERWYFNYNIDTIRTMKVDGQLYYYVNMGDCTSQGLEQLFSMWNSRTIDSYVQEYQRMLKD